MWNNPEHLRNKEKEMIIRIIEFFGKLLCAELLFLLGQLIFLIQFRLNSEH